MKHDAISRLSYRHYLKQGVRTKHYKIGVYQFGDIHKRTK